MGGGKGLVFTVLWPLYTFKYKEITLGYYKDDVATKYEVTLVILCTLNKKSSHPTVNKTRKNVL